MKLFTKVKRATGKKLFVLFALFLSLSVGGVVGVNAMSSSSVVNAATNCSDVSPNSIISGGASSRSKLISDVNNSSELQKIYANSNFNLQKGDYSNFVKNAKSGFAYRSYKGHSNVIVVDGQIVGTSAGSIGRKFDCQEGSGGSSVVRTFNIDTGKNNNKYYGSLNQYSMGSNSLPVDVLFDGHGQAQFAVMTGDCGNPMYFHKNNAPECNHLTVNQTGADQNHYELTTSIDKNNSTETINKVVYSFSDGSPDITSRSASTNYKVDFTAKKNVTVTSTVYINLPGGGTAIAKSNDCSKQIKFVLPKANTQCGVLTATAGKLDNQGNTLYTLTADKTVADNATIKSYTFTFGDGKPNMVVKTSANHASTTHAYATGDYTAKVLVTFVTNTGKTVTDGNDGKCATPVKAGGLVCNDLTLTKGSVDKTTGNTVYTLSAKATPTNASISNFVFSFGDNKTQTVSAGNATSAKTVSADAHTYAPGTYQVSVVVNGKDTHGNAFTNVTSTDCAKTITVQPPAGKLVCGNLTVAYGTANAQGNTPVTLTATANATNVTITKYVFTFGDGSADKPVVPDVSTPKTASTTHTYAPKATDYTASVTVFGTDNATGKVVQNTNQYCQQPVHVQIPECKPGVPVGSPECSTFACVSLDLVPGTPAADGTIVYTLNATATATGDNKITNYVFSFGDGTADFSLPSTVTNASTTHTYAPSTTVRTAKVTVFGTGNNTVISDTNANCAKPVTPTPVKNPNITITKTVGDEHVKQKTVQVGQNFPYQLIVKNTGDQDLTNVLVTDTAPAGVSLLSADLGTVNSETTWSYTIPSLAKGDSVTINIVAVVKSYVAGNLVNTACVNAPDVNPTQPSQPDSCDTATVNTPQVLPATLPNTGAGSVIGIFGASAIIATVAHRLFLSRRLSRNQ